MLGFRRAERCARRLALGLAMVAGLPLAAASQEAQDPQDPQDPQDAAAAGQERPQRPPVQERHPGLDRLRAKYKDLGSSLELTDSGAAGRAAAPAFAAAPISPEVFDPARLLAGHLLRRITFGPVPTEVTAATKRGLARYVDLQLNYGAIDDSAAMARLPKPPKYKYDDAGWQRRWFARMVYSKRQLVEVLTLIWHEHFATSNDKVDNAFLMHKQEDLLRRRALGRFPDLLTDVITDQAMLIWLDNDYNDGNAYDDDGNRVLPNANFAREFLQLFAMGPVMLNLDGTPVLDGNGLPVPSYTETDIKNISRALTGWHVDYKAQRYAKAIFDPNYHDSTPKTILGVTIPGRTKLAGALEVKDVVAIVMAHPNVAPFISKILIQKLATETPTPGYVQRVATVFQTTKGDLKKTVRAILVDSEFVSDAVVRTQFKEPIQYFVAPVRALSGITKGDAFIDWTFTTKQLIYYPPSVFSFYPPGQRGALINTALVTYRDRGTDELVAGYTDTDFNPVTLMKRYKLTTPEQVADFLADALLVAPLPDEARSAVIAYMNGSVSEEKFRGAVWLVLCSPDYQRN
jgi:uncharacterized protein (DUF1800 family)